MTHRSLFVVAAWLALSCGQAALVDRGGSSSDAGDSAVAESPDAGCAPACDARACGSDGCGGSCGDCADGTLCDDSGRCVASCTADCGGRTCGDDGCGGSCGDCESGKRCDDSGACVATCVPACDGASCGDDGCGGSCGTCGTNERCEGGACVAICTPSCAGKVCGDDDCGGGCGTCATNQRCATGACVSSCTPSCSGKACGDDGCGGSCGTCGANQRCDGNSCVTICAPSCSGKSCGDDGCGGSCGACGGGETCTQGRCVAACAPACTGRQCGDDTCGGSCGACPANTTCTNGACLCATHSELLVYTEQGPWIIAAALGADPAGCTQHWISIPAANDANGFKTMPRGGGGLTEIHRQGPSFHALAEFHWGGWSHVTNMTWREKGVEFRRRMAAAGYDLRAGDTWSINELPSTTRSDPTTRQHVRDVLDGLYAGPAGSTPLKGAVFVIGVGQSDATLGPYKHNVEDWLADASFWSGIAPDVRWWAQEVYPSPAWSCVPNTTTARRAAILNEYTEAVPLLASAGPASANTAQSFLGRAFVPLMGAVWDSSAYGDTSIPLSAMENFVSTEVYATRSWEASHAYPDGRIAFAWGHQPTATDDGLQTLAARLASSVHRAYANGASASHACSPSGAFTWCQCQLSGARANDAWTTFGQW